MTDLVRKIKISLSDGGFGVENRDFLPALPLCAMSASRIARSRFTRCFYNARRSRAHNSIMHGTLFVLRTAISCDVFLMRGPPINALSSELGFGSGLGPGS